MIYFLFLVFGLILLVHSYLMVTILRTQKEQSSLLKQIIRGKKRSQNQTSTKKTGPYPINHPKIQRERGHKR
ncbi:hypothetical protein IGI49_002526 [Enterococcus sp. AZ071]